MPFRQTHRGRHPEDNNLFGEKWVPLLQKAVEELSFLLSRGYPEKSALKLVGDRYQITTRQRRAVLGASCPDESLGRRKHHLLSPDELAGRPLSIDGYNLLIMVESALARGVLLRGRDGCIRDLASIHSSYRKVEETYPAIRLIGNTLAQLELGEVTWYFDSPVSNSGRLKAILYEKAEEHGWNWQIELHTNPDKVLAGTADVVATSDGWILNRAGAWVNLAERVIATLGTECPVIDLGSGGS